MLTADQARQLLKHPQRLLELQEQLFCRGGSFWISQFEAAEPVDASARRWKSLAPILMPALAETAVTRNVVPWWTRRRFLAAAGSLAATGVLCFGLWRLQPGGDVWGWNRPDVFAANLQGDAYLKHLAIAAKEWFQQRRDTKADLERQLVAFRRSCDSLIQARHPQPSDDQRGELVQRCRKWAGKLDDHLADLRGGLKSVGDVRVEADETIQRLVDFLEDGFS